MTPELINARFIELNKSEQDAQQRLAVAQQQANQAQADIHAINGAKQDCQYWLQQAGQQAALPNVPATPPAANDDAPALPTDQPTIPDTVN